MSGFQKDWGYLRIHCPSSNTLGKAITSWTLHRMCLEIFFHKISRQKNRILQWRPGQSTKYHIINSPSKTLMLLTLKYSTGGKRTQPRGVAFHWNWCLSFAITSNVIADIWRAFQWNFSHVGCLTDIINLRPILMALDCMMKKLIVSSNVCQTFNWKGNLNQRFVLGKTLWCSILKFRPWALLEYLIGMFLQNNSLKVYLKQIKMWLKFERI